MWEFNSSFILFFPVPFRCIILKLPFEAPTWRVEYNIAGNKNNSSGDR